jgi:hypothetical protein
MGNSFEGFNADPYEMPRHHDKPLSDAAIEDLVAGIGAGPLYELLAAARAPGTARELAGEQAALAAFRAPGSLRVAPPALAMPPGRPLLRRLLAVKAGVAAAAVLGGVALAATTGYLPNPLVPGPRSSPVGSTVPPPSWASSTAGSLGPGGPASQGVSPGPAAVPSTALPGLCRAYLTHVETKPNKPFEHPAFAVLSAMAGGDDRVLAFCKTVVDQETTKPNASITPTAPPGGAPSTTGAGDSVTHVTSNEKEQDSQ